MNLGRKSLAWDIFGSVEWVEISKIYSWGLLCNDVFGREFFGSFVYAPAVLLVTMDSDYVLGLCLQNDATEVPSEFSEERLIVTLAVFRYLHSQSLEFVS